MLARRLSPEEYGGFVVLYGVLLVSGVIHAALITYPISVIGPQKSTHELRELASVGLLLTLALDLALLAPLFAFCSALHSVSVLPMAFSAMVFWHLQETLRRCLMSHLRHAAAIPGDVVMYLGQLVMVVAFGRFRYLGLGTALFAILLAAACGLLIHIVSLGLSKPHFTQIGKSVRTKWQMGRWPLLTHAAYGVSYQSLPWMLARQTLSASATYQAALNVVAIANPLAFAIGNLVIPTVAHARSHNQNPEAPWKSTMRYMGIGLTLLVPFLVLISAQPEFMIRLLYGANSPYRVLSGMLLRILSAAALMMYVGHVLSFYFLGKEQTKTAFKTQLLASTAGIGLAIWLIPNFGPLGAASALLAMTFTRTIALLWYEYRGRMDAPISLSKLEGVLPPSEY